MFLISGPDCKMWVDVHQSFSPYFSLSTSAERVSATVANAGASVEREKQGEKVGRKENGADERKQPLGRRGHSANTCEPATYALQKPRSINLVIFGLLS
jgi:hypothetical protein